MPPGAGKRQAPLGHRERVKTAAPPEWSTSCHLPPHSIPTNHLPSPTNPSPARHLENDRATTSPRGAGAARR